MTGNKENDQILVDFDQQLMLSFYLQVYPDAEANEMAASFIYNMGGRVYSRAAISKRLKAIVVSRKASSTEAYQAFTPQIILRKNLFWSQNDRCG